MAKIISFRFSIFQKKSFKLRVLELESLRAWHYQEGSTPTCLKKTLKKSKFNGANLGCKKNAPISLFYKQIVCPLLLKYNKVHLASPLTCQTPNVNR